MSQFSVWFLENAMDTEHVLSYFQVLIRWIVAVIFAIIIGSLVASSFAISKHKAITDVKAKQTVYIYDGEPHIPEISVYCGDLEIADYAKTKQWLAEDCGEYYLMANAKKPYKGAGIVKWFIKQGKPKISMAKYSSGSTMVRVTLPYVHDYIKVNIVDEDKTEVASTILKGIHEKGSKHVFNLSKELSPGKYTINVMAVSGTGKANTEKVLEVK